MTPGAHLCFYAFMRTTVELPADLMKRAKAEAAERGESLKTLFTKAIAAEVGIGRHGARVRARVKVPIFGNKNGPLVKITNIDIEQALADEDAASARRFSQKRKR